MAAITELFAGRSFARTRSSLTAMSSPQATEPPALPIKVMRWTPRPSFRTAFAIGAIALGYFAARKPFEAAG